MREVRLGRRVPARANANARCFISTREDACMKHNLALRSPFSSQRVAMERKNKRVLRRHTRVTFARVAHREGRDLREAIPERLEALGHLPLVTVRVHTPPRATLAAALPPPPPLPNIYILYILGVK